MIAWGCLKNAGIEEGFRKKTAAADFFSWRSIFAFAGSRESQHLGEFIEPTAVQRQ
jgi:hypothetical protein